MRGVGIKIFENDIAIVQYLQAKYLIEALILGAKPGI